MDTVVFEKRLQSSQIFTNPADTPDTYLEQIELAVSLLPKYLTTLHLCVTVLGLAAERALGGWIQKLLKPSS
jgi:hypothetical protein